MAPTQVTPIEAATSPIALCPLCSNPDGIPSGSGDTPVNQLGQNPKRPGHGMPACRLCKGRRFLYVDKICTCGGPAVWYQALYKLWYCGNEFCMNYMKNRTAHPGAWVGY